VSVPVANLVVVATARVLDLLRTRAHTPPKATPRYCEAPGCGAPTRRSKPYCPGHVGFSPHAYAVMGELETARAEAAHVLAGGRAGSEGLLAREVLAYLQRHGAATAGRLGRDVVAELIEGVGRDGEAKLVATRVLQALARAGRVRTRGTSRGDLVGEPLGLREGAA